MGASSFCEFMTLLVGATPLLNPAEMPTLVRLAPCSRLLWHRHQCHHYT